MKSSSQTISTSESSVLIWTGRPKATATERSRVNNVHQIRFQRRLSGRLSCDPSTLKTVSQSSSRVTTNLPSMHARTLRNYSRNSSPVKHVFRNVLSDVNARPPTRASSSPPIPSGPSQYHPINTSAWTIVTRSSS